MSTKNQLLKQQRQWAVSRGHQVDSRGYVLTRDANLFQPMSPRTEHAFKCGGGSELLSRDEAPPKIQALHSSAALAVNVFDRWSERELAPMVAALGLKGRATKLEFERQFPTGLGGTPPNLDVAIGFDSGSVTGVESKFSEWLTPKPAGKELFKPKYFPKGAGECGPFKRGLNAQVFARAWIGFVLILVSIPAWSAATLAGIVSLNHERGTPVAGVEVSAKGANPVTSGNDGLFMLSFPDGRPGQDVRVRVARSGWDVVNDILLDHRLPDSPNARPLEIIVCLSAERELRVAEFYRLKGNQAVEQTYRVKLAELEGRQAASVQERDRLLRERDQARNQVEEWARQSASRKPEEVVGIYRDALRLFLDGKADVALQLLSDERLQQEADKAQAQLNQAVQGWLLKGQLLSSKFDYDGAGGAYEKAVKAAPASHPAWFGYAHFHQSQNHYVQARRGYEQALTVARLASNDSDVADTLNNLGILSRDENRDAEARKQYEEALDLYRALAKKNPDVYLPYVAMTLNNLSILSSDENRNAEARKEFEEALDLYRSLAQKNPDIYLPYVAVTLNNLGNLSRAENRSAESRKQYEEALDIRRSLANKNSDVYLPDVAMTLNNLGILSSDENRNAEARKEFEEALDIRRLLAKKNPGVYLRNVAVTLNNLGNVSRAENRNAESRKQFEEALDIRRALARKDPDVYLPDVAATLNNLGILNSNEKRYAEARKQYEEALDLYRALARKNPDVYLPDVAMTLNNLGVMSHAENRSAESRKHFEEALDIRRSLARKNPDVYLPDVAATLNNLGILSSDENRNAEARKQFEEAADIFRQFAARAPATYGPRLKSVEDTIQSLQK
jgi:tetratricopeptide (TPR) repeat protein